MLPKIDVPIYNVELPLTKKKIRYRPFLVKEEKLLMMAMESEDVKGVTTTIKQIANNCILDEVDVDDLPVLDLEFLFLQLRARSVNEIVEMNYKCNNIIKDEEGGGKSCDHVVKVEFNIFDIKPTFDEKHTNKIELSAELGIVLRYPTFESIEMIDDVNDVEKVFSILSTCIDYIYDAENIYYTKDATKEEIDNFIDGMTREQFEKVKVFFDTMPRLKKKVDFKCGKCGYSEEIEVEGIQNFFG
jgi:DNA-directed RNA polymerase subunit M/transcription elongation factor TFIIS